MHYLNPLYLEAAVLVLALAIIVFEMFVESVDRRILAWVGMAGLGVIFVASFYAGFPPESLAPGAVPAPYLNFYAADPLAMFFKRFALLTTIIVLVMSVEYLPVVRKFTPGSTLQGGLGEFLALPILTCAGLMWMASAVDFVMIFVSLEMVTISFYVLVSYTRRNAATLEAGVKYLILGALSTGFFVYGITWIFGLTGETNLTRISVALAQYRGSTAPLLFSFILVTIALGFKIAAFPFQIWVPDVYQGAPTPITAFLSVGSKAAGFVVFIRVLDTFFNAPAIVERVGTVLVVMAAATLIYGNLAALPQNNLKRLLAYSSIAHAGYLLVAIASAARMTAPSPTGTLSPGGAIAFYLAAYLLMTLLAFTVMIVVANHSAGDDLSDFNGLGKRSPFLAFAMLIAMLSLAGLPFTVGFFGKFFIFTVALAQRQFFLAGVSVVTVACGFYYYLRVVRAMYFQPTTTGTDLMTAIPMHWLTRATIGALIALILFLGVYPMPLLGVTDSSNQHPAETASARTLAPSIASGRR
jgi:NADH-quinone oxidoreductase subunit N